MIIKLKKKNENSFLLKWFVSHTLFNKYLVTANLTKIKMNLRNKNQ